jgi:citrate lyase subunit beta / citryl-CoA lyase
MRRSLLFIPASHPAMIQNADVFDADGIIFDLEDAVEVSVKDAARDLISSYLKKTYDLKAEILIRVNHSNFDILERDVKATLSNKITSYVLPKASVESLLFLDQLLLALEKKENIKKKIHVLPIIESAKALLDLENIAKCPRVNGLILGAEDLATDMEIDRTDSGIEIMYARSQMVLVAKANHIEAIDTPFTNTQDMSGLKADALMAKRLGMQAKLAIHPNQIHIINETFSVSQEQIDYAKKVLKAYEIHQKGVFSLDGKMIDEPIIERARKILLKAKKWGQIGEE